MEMKVKTIKEVVLNSSLKDIEKRILVEHYINALVDRTNSLSLYRDLYDKILIEGLDGHKEYGIILSKYSDSCLRANTALLSAVEKIQKALDRVEDAGFDLSSMVFEDMESEGRDRIRKGK